MKTNNTIAYVYNRINLDEDDKYVTYLYEFSGIKVCKPSKDNRYLIPQDEKKNKLAFINDVDNLGNECVYAFPYQLTDEEAKNQEEIFGELQNISEKIQSCLFYQVYEKGNDTLKTYYLDSEIEDLVSEINMESVEGINDIFDENRKKVSEVSQILKKALRDAKQEQEESNVLYSNELFEKLNKTILCQDEQLKVIIANIIKNLSINQGELKSNLLICGPKGVGKTEIFRCIADYLDVPIVIKNITEMTDTAEKCMTDLLYTLYVKAEGDIEKVQRGIIIIDKIDEQIKADGNSYNTNAFLEDLLRISKGYTFHFEDEEKSIDLDTSFMTFVFISGFLKRLGYIRPSEIETKDGQKQAIIKCDLNRNFVEQNNVVVLNALDIEDFCKIMNESDKSVFLLYKYMFEDLGIKLIYDESCLEAVAKKAKELGVGAHSLKSIFEKAFEIILYHVYSDQKYSELTITPETFEDNYKFILK